MTNTMSEEKKADLKACPFCNSTRIVKGERYFAMCVDCGATGPERVRENTAARIYNGDWNTRPREGEIAEVLKTLFDKLEYEFRQDTLYAQAGQEKLPKPSERLVFARSALSQITAALKEEG